MKEVITRYFSVYGESDGMNVADNLMNMITVMADKLCSGTIDRRKLKWVMTLDTFNWITNLCDGVYGLFYYRVEYSYTRPTRYTIMDTDVMLVNDDYMNRCRIVKLEYVEPIDITWNHDSVQDTTWDCISKSLGGINLCKWPFSTGTIEERKEKPMKSFYVTYGKKVSIENVIFNNPATIVFWSDGTKTVVKRQKSDKKFDPEKGLAMAICKKVMGNKGNFNDIFKEWIEED